MEIVEIRELEGPNLFLLEPAVKIEVFASPNERSELTRRLAAHAGVEETAALSVAWSGAVESLHASVGQPAPATCVMDLDEPGHVAFAFGWSHRPFARAAADALVGVATGFTEVVDLASLHDALSDDADPPLIVEPGEYTATAIAITGTNGKTTTTRLLSHLFREAGKRTGWTSSSGIYVDGALVKAGDYSGPSGAREVLRTPGLDIAILETARGGILLRGLGYRQNDVSVFTNVSADHLGLQGVLTVERLAQVKSVICKVTRPDGWAVLNADDERVMAATAGIAANRCLVSKEPSSTRIQAHFATGGRAVLLQDGAVVIREGAEISWSMPVAEIPICVGGRARHQVENSLCATGAAYCAGLSPERIERGLRSFKNDLADNPGRLNVLEHDGITVVLDYAHNEAGLAQLIEFGRSLTAGGRIISVIGTAGDRADESIVALGRIAAERSDYVIAKGTERYLRGRDPGELMDLYRRGASEHPDTPYDATHDEAAGLDRALEIARPGDVVLLMFQELLGEVEERLAASRSQTS